MNQIGLLYCPCHLPRIGIKCSRATQIFTSPWHQQRRHLHQQPIRAKARPAAGAPYRQRQQQRPRESREPRGSAPVNDHDANPTGLQLTFLGTAAEHGRDRRKFSLAVRTTRCCVLFDVCEDVQRALLHAEHVRPSRITRIFISCLDGDQICGLPGMLCTASAARERGHELSDTPLHIYGPAGIAHYCEACLRLSDTYLLMPVVIHEFSTQPPDLSTYDGEAHILRSQPEEWHPESQLINRRAKLWVCTLPPDQLNPAGYYDGSQSVMLQRRNVRKARGLDQRSGVLPLPLPPPGDPAAEGVRVPDMSWTIRSDDEYLVVAMPLPRDGVPCLAYTLIEADRTGVLDPEKAQAMGIRPGKAFGQLKAGLAVVSDDGRTIEASEVLGPTRLGRKVVLVGDTLRPQLSPVAAGCHTIVAPAFSQGQSTAAEAGALASDLGAQQLILTRFAAPGGVPVTGRQQQEQEAAGIQEAQVAWPGGQVLAAGELEVMNIPRQDSGNKQQPVITTAL